MFKKVVSDLNGLDIVINNAGIYNDKKWEQTMCINVVSKISVFFRKKQRFKKHYFNFFYKFSRNTEV